jgi:hypothetical protein
LTTRRFSQIWLLSKYERFLKKESFIVGEIWQFLNFEICHIRVNLFTKKNLLYVLKLYFSGLKMQKFAPQKKSPLLSCGIDI